jgi:hypothetical protein
MQPHATHLDGVPAISITEDEFFESGPHLKE